MSSATAVRVALLVLLAVLLAFPALAAAAPAPGAEGFQAALQAEGGGPATVAGAHPRALTAHLALGTGEEGLRDLRLGLPPGLLIEPLAVARCTPTVFSLPGPSPFEPAGVGESCPDTSQVGTVDLEIAGAGGGAVRRFALFDLVPTPGAPAQLGFVAYGTPIVLDLQLRAGAGDQYAFSIEATALPRALGITGLGLEIWGAPWGAGHDGERGECLNQVEPSFPWAKCQAGSPAREPTAFLTTPTDCGHELAFSLSVSSWSDPVASSVGSSGPAPTGCRQLAFSPVAFGQLNGTSASSASGFAFRLLQDEEGELTDPGARIRTEVGEATVLLPEGVTINPSLGVGLGTCTPAQYATEAAIEPAGSGCPNQARIGSLSVDTPLLEEPLEGGIYLAEPDDPRTSTPGAENPFGSLLAVYLIARSPQYGVLVKVAGELIPDPRTGRLTAVFRELPQLPYTALEAKFRVGQRAPLVTPATCGSFATRIELAPWGEAGRTVGSETISKIETGAGSGSCPSGALAPFSPTITAGSVNSEAGAYTPFYLRLARNDAEQEITSYSAVLPRGVTGRIAGIPFCPDAAIQAARGRSGAEEIAEPSCPAASQVGRTLSGYGVGSTLAYSPGQVYLAGPYSGAPLSLVTIDAAVLGPFDLGTIVIRSAFEIDPTTAQLRIDPGASDPIPHILDGIPLHLREVRVYIDRPEFTRNPTSCEPSQVISTVTGSGARFDDPSDDTSATVSSYFQLLDCRELPFRPKLGLRLRGGSRRGAFPSLRATFAARPGDADLRRIAVTMPHSEFLAQQHIRAICTRAQFAAEACPAGSRYGRAVAYTPLFEQPLRGPVYLRSSSGRLPDLVASLRSGTIHIVLDGRIEPAHGGIRAFFDELPDAPIERFVLRLYGGRRGLLVNSSDICAAPPQATVKALGQNNLGRIFQTKLRGRCGGPKKRGRR